MTRKLVLIVICLLALSQQGCKKETSLVTSKSGIVYLLGSSNETVNQSLALSDGSIAMVGTKAGDAYLRIIESDGSLRSLKTFGGSGEDCFYDIIETKSTELVVVGFTSSPEFGTTDSSSDTWIMRFNAQGTQEIWSTIFGSGFDERLNAVAETDGGSLLAVGLLDAGVRATILYEFDAAGNFAGGQSFNIGPYRSEARDILATGDGDFLISGLSSVSAIVNQTYLMQTYLFKYSLQTNSRLWTRIYGNARSRFMYEQWFPVNISKTNTGYLLSTWFQADGSLSATTELYFVDNVGKEISSKTINGLNTSRPNGVHATQDGAFLVLGHSSTSPVYEPNGKRAGKAMMLKIDQEGNELWSSYFGTDQLLQFILSVYESPNEFRVAGIAFDSELGTSKVMVFSTDKEGRLNYGD